MTEEWTWRRAWTSTQTPPFWPYQVGILGVVLPVAVLLGSGGTVLLIDWLMGLT